MTAADTVYPMLFGSLSPELWLPSSADGAASEPWLSFARAHQSLQAGDQAGATRSWQHVTSLEGIESRQVLQAWHFLRAVGVYPSPSEATDVLGAIAEVAVNGGHDVLAAYRDGSVRYLNHAGAC